jgi:O-antigen/teichoic acid export membrane protein
MNSPQSIAKNMTSLFIGSIFSSVLAVILSIFIARFLGDVTFGEYSFVTAFIALFSIFLDLGYETLLIIDVAKEKSKASTYVSNIISFRIVLSMLIFVVIFLLINILNFPEESKILIYLFGISQIISTLSNVFRVTFRAFQRMDYEAGVSIFSNILRCSLGLLVLLLGHGLMEMALIFLFSAIFEFLVSFLICEKKFTKVKMEFDLSFFRKTLKFAIPLGALAIFSMIQLRICIVMLEFMKGDAVVGWYNAAFNLILAFSPIPLIFMNTLLPYMAHLSTQSKNSLKELFEKSFKFLFIFSLPATVGIFLLADRFIVLFYGQNFLNSVTALRILSFDVMLKFLCLCVYSALISVNKQGKVAIICGCAALLNVVLNLFLIPEFSLVGAAIAIIISATFVLIMYLYIAFRNGLKIPIQKIIIKPLIACIGMIFFIYYFNDMNLYLLISFSILLYFGLFFIMKGFSKEEISFLKDMVIKKK